MNDDALKLWKRVIDELGDNPYEYNDYGGYCFFCGAYEKDEHDKYCTYVLAKELIIKAYSHD